MPFRLTRAGVEAPSDRERPHWREAFDRQHCLRFDDFLEPALLDWIRGALAGARFGTRIHAALSPPVRDTVLEDALLQARLLLITNDAALFSAVEAITGCDAIGCFAPVVRRQDPGDGNHDEWHGDVDGNRLVGLSINVGEKFDGSAIELRDHATQTPVHRATNAEPGSALLFRISPDLQHRVAALEGGASRTVLTGWFQRQPVLTARSAREYLGLAAP